MVVPQYPPPLQHWLLKSPPAHVQPPWLGPQVPSPEGMLVVMHELEDVVWLLARPSVTLPARIEGLGVAPSSRADSRARVTYHPCPQWFAVVPQLPVLEQQVLNVEPTHVLPLDPHLPSVETAPLPLLQVPKLLWQPAPQWSVVPPQFPLGEQQVPKPEPVHVLPLDPHLPSVEMLPLPLLHVPKPD